MKNKKQKIVIIYLSDKQNINEKNEQKNYLKKEYPLYLKGNKLHLAIIFL